MTGSGIASASVVVCSYTEDRWDDLRAAVDSLARQTVLPHEIVVVVDHNDVLLDRAERAFAAAVVVPNKEGRGLSGARNTGVAQATGDVVAFLDDDAAAASTWLETMLAAYADPRVVGVGTTVAAQWPAGRPGWFPPEFDWVVGCSYVGLPERTGPVRNPIGAAMSFRRSVFDHVGGFSAELGRVGTLPLGCEETEFCIRIRQAQPEAVILFEPSATVRHRVGAGRTTVAYFLRRCFAEGVSKATVGSRVGRDDALSTERVYVRRVLPRAVRRGLTSPREGWRAASVVLGLTVTSAGYLRGAARERFARAS
jgi:glucosyl-dolichyl phosphate glucuronosyltransferase